MGEINSQMAEREKPGLRGQQGQTGNLPQHSLSKLGDSPG